MRASIGPKNLGNAAGGGGAALGQGVVDPFETRYSPHRQSTLRRSLLILYTKCQGSGAQGPLTLFVLSVLLVFNGTFSTNSLYRPIGV